MHCVQSGAQRVTYDSWYQALVQLLQMHQCLALMYTAYFVLVWKHMHVLSKISTLQALFTDRLFMIHLLH